MPGFRYCSWCGGKGCMCCDAEQKKWEEAEARRREEHARRTPDQVRQSIRDLEWTRDGGDDHDVSLGAKLSVAMAGGHGGFDKAKIDRAIAAEQAILDAEYARRFPDGPTPILIVREGNAKDEELMKSVFHADRLDETFGPGGGGMGEIERRCEAARSQQDPPIDYKPIGAPS